MSALTSGLLATRLVRCWVTCYTLGMLVGYLVQAWLVVSSFLAPLVGYLCLVCNTGGFLFIFVVLLVYVLCFSVGSDVTPLVEQWVYVLRGPPLLVYYACCNLTPCPLSDWLLLKYQWVRSVRWSSNAHHLRNIGFFIVSVILSHPNVTEHRVCKSPFTRNLKVAFVTGWRMEMCLCRVDFMDIIRILLYTSWYLVWWKPKRKRMVAGVDEKIKMGATIV